MGVLDRAADAKQGASALPCVVSLAGASTWCGLALRCARSTSLLGWPAAASATRGAEPHPHSRDFEAGAAHCTAQ